MPKITALTETKDNQKINVFIDGEYCCSIRKRTWQAMDLRVGSLITCENLKEKENYFWKQAYGQQSWEAEKKRLERVEAWIKKYLPEVIVERVGFGADTTDFIKQHPDEHGSPDLKLIIDGDELIALEVSGTERQSGSDYWVRPDKLTYAQKHSEKDVWIVLHYKLPKERFIWLKPILEKQYQFQEKEIRGAIEYYVTFNDGDDEIKSSKEFQEYVLEIVKAKKRP